MEWATSIAAVRATAAGTVEEIKHTVVSFKRVVLPILGSRVDEENGIRSGICVVNKRSRQKKD